MIVSKMGNSIIIYFDTEDDKRELMTVFQLLEELIETEQQKPLEERNYNVRRIFDSKAYETIRKINNIIEELKK